MSVAPLSDEWVAALVTATAARTPVDGLDGVVTLAIGKTTRVTIEIVAGQVTGQTDREGDVEVPFTKPQLGAWSEGDLVPSVAYMKGDLKPVGATGPFLALLAVMDDPTVAATV